MGGGTTGTAAGLSQAAGASKFPLAPSPTGINPLEAAQPEPFSTTCVVNSYIQRKDLCCVGALRTQKPGPRAGGLRQHRALDDPPVLVDGKVVIPGVVQALLDPCLQVLRGDEAFGFLLNQRKRIIPLRIIPPCSQSSGSASIPSTRCQRPGKVLKLCSQLPTGKKNLWKTSPRLPHGSLAGNSGSLAPRRHQLLLPAAAEPPSPSPPGKPPFSWPVSLQSLISSSSAPPLLSWLSPLCQTERKM